VEGYWVLLWGIWVMLELRIKLEIWLMVEIWNFWVSGLDIGASWGQALDGNKMQRLLNQYPLPT
jgi:hypothetical protein